MKKRLQSTHQELLKQENLLKKQKKIKAEIYEMKLNREIAELLEQKIEEKKQEIHQTLEEMKEPDFEKMYHIKMLISYCKRMSSLVISNYRKEKYNQERMKLILEELLWDAKNQKVEGVIQLNHFEITSSETITIYEVVFEVLNLLQDIHFKKKW